MVFCRKPSPYSRLWCFSGENHGLVTLNFLWSNYTATIASYGILPF